MGIIHKGKIFLWLAALISIKSLGQQKQYFIPCDNKNLRFHENGINPGFWNIDKNFIKVMIVYVRYNGDTLHLVNPVKPLQPVRKFRFSDFTNLFRSRSSVLRRSCSFYKEHGNEISFVYKTRGDFKNFVINHDIKYIKVLMSYSFDGNFGNLTWCTDL